MSVFGFPDCFSSQNLFDCAVAVNQSVPCFGINALGTNVIPSSACRIVAPPTAGPPPSETTKPGTLNTDVPIADIPKSKFTKSRPKSILSVDSPPVQNGAQGLIRDEFPAISLTEKQPSVDRRSSQRRFQVRQNQNRFLFAYLTVAASVIFIGAVGFALLNRTSPEGQQAEKQKDTPNLKRNRPKNLDTIPRHPESDSPNQNSKSHSAKLAQGHQQNPINDDVSKNPFKVRQDNNELANNPLSRKNAESRQHAESHKNKMASNPNNPTDRTKKQKGKQPASERVTKPIFASLAQSQNATSEPGVDSQVAFWD